MPITIQWERAERVFGALLKALETKTYPYDRAVLPQGPENLPKSLMWGSPEHARFLFCVCYYMRGGIESDTAILALAKIFGYARHLFDPRYFVDADPIKRSAEVTEYLRQESLNYKSIETGRFWDFNFRKLARFWDSHPANLFLNATSYRRVCRNIMHRGVKTKSPDHRTGFYGFREKMVSMLLYFLNDAGILPKATFPVPVDFHVLRVLVSHELLTVDDVGLDENILTKPLLDAARELTHGYCDQHGMDSKLLADALWLLSRDLCYLNPGNRTRVGPRNGRKTAVTLPQVIWNDLEVQAYQRSCAECPIRTSCVHNVPSGHYYVKGEIRRFEKDKPLLLF